MATQAASKAVAANDASAEPVDDSKSDQALQAKITDFIRQYAPPPGKGTPDTLSGRYRIERSQPLAEYDSKTGRAFNAVDAQGEYKKLYALVLGHGRLARYQAIEKLKTARIPGLINLVAAGAVEFSQPNEERYVIVYERPEGKKLSEVVDNLTAPLNDYFIINSIISPMIATIQQISELGLTHGAINPDNIYFGTSLILGDMASEPCGYSQPFYYEPLERMQCLNAGKGEGTSAQDYYAMAVVVLFMIFGRKHFAGLTQDALVKSILRDGAHTALMRNQDTSLLMDEFFRGTIGQDVEHRWNYRYLKSWVEGRRSSAIVGRGNTEVLKPFEYGDGEAEILAGSRRELAAAFFAQWNHLVDVIQGGKLVSWMSINLRNKELVGEINRIVRSVSQVSGRQDIQLAEQFMRLILVLDPEGPIRISPLSMMPDGAASLIAELFYNKADKELQLLIKFIEHDMAAYWSQVQPDERDTKAINSMNAALTKLDKLRLIARNPALGFGIERILYELNPEMECQSPLFANAHVTTLASLLRRLDALAPSLSAQDPMDRHIAAFISQKLNLQGEVKLHELTAIPSLATNPSIIALRLLALAQHRANNLQLPGLSHWLASRILPSLSVIRSRSLRQRLKAALLQRAGSASLTTLESLVIDNSYSSADKGGYQKAVSGYAENTQRIGYYRNGSVIDRDSTLAGATIAKSIAYVAFVVVFFFVLRENL